MKNILRQFYTSILIVFIIAATYAEDNTSPIQSTNLQNIDWSSLDKNEIELITENIKNQSRLNTFNLLQSIKFMLLNGNISGAKNILHAIEINSSPLATIISKKYWAQIYFIEGNYKKSLSILNHINMNNSRSYPKICLMKIYDLIILSRSKHSSITNEQIQREFKKCSAITQKYSPNDHLFLNIIVQSLDPNSTLIKKGFRQAFKYLDFSEEDLFRILFKGMLYLDFKKELENMATTIHFEQLKDPKIRELLGFYFYRTKNKEFAMKSLSNIITPNSENIKGNLKLEEKQYELAYGHYQMALKLKKNSLNAIERITPLAWILKKWDEGIGLIEKLPAYNQKYASKLTLISAFKTRNNNFKDAYKNLSLVDHLYQGAPPKETAVLFAYNSLIEGNLEMSKKQSSIACYQNDGLSCLNLWYLKLIPQYNILISKNIPTYDDQEVTLENIKESKEVEPLKEDIFINQNEIEELDNQFFELQYLNKDQGQDEESNQKSSLIESSSANSSSDD